MCFNNSRIYGENLAQEKCSLVHSGFGCSPFKGSGSVVVDSLLIAAPIAAICVCSVFETRTCITTIIVSIIIVCTDLHTKSYKCTQAVCVSFTQNQMLKVML